VNHNLCSLLHWLAGFPAGEYRRVSTLEHCDAIPTALSNGLVECPDATNPLDRYHLRLTPKGLELTLESLNAMEAVS
jgi:hypothetical protein